METMVEGRIVQIIGSTLDAEFPRGKLPEIYDALVVDTEVSGRTIKLTTEVQQHLGGNRCAQSPGSTMACPRHEDFNRSTVTGPVAKPLWAECSISWASRSQEGPSRSKARTIHQAPPLFKDLGRDQFSKREQGRRSTRSLLEGRENGYRGGRRRKDVIIQELIQKSHQCTAGCMFSGVGGAHAKQRYVGESRNPAKLKTTLVFGQMTEPPGAHRVV